MSVPGESYEQWLARTAPQKPARTINPRSWDWGVIVLLGVFFVWVGTGARVWIGIALVLVLASEELLRGRLSATSGARHALRGAALLATLALSGWIIWVEGGVAALLPALLVLLDLKDDRSFLRWALGRFANRPSSLGS